MGTLLFGAGLTYELIARKMSNVAYRTAVGVAVATAVLLVWVNAAVGIIGDDNPANLMYFGVLTVGIIGALIARFKPHGMARALFATALAQALVAMIALTFYSSAEPGPLGILAVNGFFVALWVGSALLFRRAARKHN
jgi:peptidoglycan/LPS O-acetylase OafA/YrhL